MKKTYELSNIMKKIIMVMIVFNLISIPNTIKSVTEYKNIKTHNINNNKRINECSKEKIEKWLKYINNSAIKEAAIKEEESFIKIDTMDSYYNAGIQKNLKIKYIKNESDGFVLGVAIKNE